MKKRLAAAVLSIMLLMMCMSFSAALADGELTLPTALTEIGDKAFYNNSSIETVTIQNGTTSIGELAFANSGLKSITIPDSVTYIAENAFDGCTGLTFYVHGGSYAAQWCTAHCNDENNWKCCDTIRDVIVKAIVELAKAQLGKPYLYGAHGPDKFDCSGFVYYVYHDVIIPQYSSQYPKLSTTKSYIAHSAYKISMSSAPVIESLDDLEPGDIICSDNGLDGICDHVGIYIGNDYFIHASTGSSNKVVMTKIHDKSNGNYYVNHFMYGKRVLP